MKPVGPEYRAGFEAGERSAARIIVAFLCTLAKPGTQPDDYYRKAAARIAETHDVPLPCMSVEGDRK